MVNPKSSVTLFIGKDAYLKEKAIKEMASSILGKSSKRLDFKVFSGGETEAREVVDYAATFPFSSASRFIVIRDFDEFSPEDRACLIAYLKKPSNTASIAIDTANDFILKEDPTLKKFVTIISIGDLTDEELFSWIKKAASSRGKQIEDDAAEILKELKGGDLLSLTQEIEKLAAFTGKSKSIKVSDVESAVGRSVVSSIFDLGRVICDKNTHKALELASGLILSGKKTHEIIGLLTWHFKLLLKGLILKAKGETNFSISNILRVRREYTNEFFKHMKPLDIDKIKSKMSILLEADLDIKSSRLDPALALEFAIMRLCLV